MRIQVQHLVSPTPFRAEPTLGGDLGLAHAAQEEFVGTSVDLEGTSLPVPGQIWRLSPAHPGCLPALLLCWDTQGQTLQKRLHKPLPLHLH